MTVQLAPDLQDLVRELLASGEFESEDQVIRTALLELARRQLDLAAIRAGMADVEAGRVVPHEDVVREMQDHLRSLRES